MSSKGPQLPPNLAKRKRNPDNDADSAKTSLSKTSRGPGVERDSDDDGYGPSATETNMGTNMPPDTSYKPVMGPTMYPRDVAAGPSLPPTNTDETALNFEENDASKLTDTVAAREPTPKCVRGPAPPPAPLSTCPKITSDSESDSESHSDFDDYGPALPSSTSYGPTRSENHHTQQLTPKQPEAPKRDDWMLVPPPPSTGYQEGDPTKLKARKFASGSSATTRPKAGLKGVSSIWTETPKEKARRLADAMLGRVTDADAGPVAKSDGPQQQARSEGYIRTFTEQARGRSLYEEHQAARKAGKSTKAGRAPKAGREKNEEDDPSMRAFDREKDMALGRRITASQRAEMLRRASEFGGRFSKGHYL